MYLAMADLGIDTMEKVKSLQYSKDKWDVIAGIAAEYGFSGIQIDPLLYVDKLGLSLEDIPRGMKQFRLTYHLGELYTLACEEAYLAINNKLLKYLEYSEKYGIEDVSFHPPDSTEDKKRITKDYLKKLIEHWLPKYQERGITLSLETHVEPQFFVFDWLEDYARFVSVYPDLGVLIDISHNFYDGFEVREMLSLLGGAKVTGMHISDAIRNRQLREGTHLPIGKGEIDFNEIVGFFKDKQDVYGALEIKALSEDIKKSVTALKSMLK